MRFNFVCYFFNSCIGLFYFFDCIICGVGGYFFVNIVYQRKVEGKQMSEKRKLFSCKVYFEKEMKYNVGEVVDYCQNLL